MNVIEYMKQNLLYLDGGMGTLLHSSGLALGELPERLNLTRPELICDIHLRYLNAGSNVISTNTFGANLVKFCDSELEEIVSAAIKNAKEAIKAAKNEGPMWVALDIGPTGKMLKPYGELDFEDAVGIFRRTAELGAKYGADLIFIETMSDSYETKAALIGAKEASSLPVFVSNAYGEDGKLLTGADAAAMVAMLEGLGADAIGVNCSLGPKALFSVVRDYLKYSSVPVIFKPNAGLPRVDGERTVYDVSPSEFSYDVSLMVKEGVLAVGGCCGTTPEYIAELVKATTDIKVCAPPKKNYSFVTSYTHAVRIGEEPVLIGERINPTGKPRLKEALRSHDTEYILKEALAEEEAGAHILDVNVGLPEIDEAVMLSDTVTALQSVTDLPLCIDTSDYSAMEIAMRRYNGKPLINSVNGKTESMNAVFPLVKKYGGVVIALTLDEGGIPENAEGRVKIAEKILNEARKYGLGKKDIVFDPLALTVSADSGAAKETLLALRLIRERLGCYTSLGVSNVSFGLPKRDTVNSAFFTLALKEGLSMAIMNPFSTPMIESYYTARMLLGMDKGCADYIAYSSVHSGTEKAEKPVPVLNLKENSATDTEKELMSAIIKGLKDSSLALTKRLLLEKAPLSVVEEEIIPALNTVGEGFENKKIYLPELLMSAEAAKAAFEAVKDAMPLKNAGDKQIVIATVKGDIHDIGKNIVKLLLENYGYSVIDLGRDVEPQKILEAVENTHCPLVGLSALMTTTVVSMERTIVLLKKHAPWCRIMVGGAVMNAEYAERIGAHMYAKDAMEAVRCADALFKKSR